MVAFGSAVDSFGALLDLLMRGGEDVFDRAARVGFYKFNRHLVHGSICKTDLLTFGRAEARLQAESPPHKD